MKIHPIPFRVILLQNSSENSTLTKSGSLVLQFQQMPLLTNESIITYTNTMTLVKGFHDNLGKPATEW